MRTLVETLYAAQPMLTQPQTNATLRQRTLEELQKSIPAQVLAHFLRLVAQGRKGAALVTNGVCSACHLRVAAGVVHGLARPRDLFLCENCGAYLMLAPDEMPEARARALPVATTVRRPRAAKRVLAA